ncbi:hypothetical protein Leryth_015782 [Lithospermum erythrorhizon]|nr:hypothetical protein Leryth_015782 [Lithospermum erythrorhizon]
MKIVVGAAQGLSLLISSYNILHDLDHRDLVHLNRLCWKTLNSFYDSQFRFTYLWHLFDINKLYSLCYQ